MPRHSVRRKAAAGFNCYGKKPAEFIYLSLDNPDAIVFVLKRDEELLRHQPRIDTNTIRVDIDIDLRIDIDTLHRTFDSGYVVRTDRFIH
ncbi:hypothetical protein BN2476_240013 [Paraburkholderia piptadeniae]|uniref:Uncharacterized protein n=1 Tax=Paraburkholderia piptadeniae TaxID=1701573 RepID=A0A1N7RYI8_9BURK|nr:hypothetical protein BN2476_240013 [Paraburkholderia piptadeniae]